MFAPMNFMVRTYLRKWNKELHEIKINCPEVQKKELQKILNSSFVKFIHGTVDAANYEQFRNTFQLTTYEDIKDRVIELKENSELKCAYFATSSGTTSGEKKIIPTPEEFVKMNHLRGSWYILHTLYEHDRKMSVFKCKNLLVGGSIYEKNDKHLIGDVSGIMLNRIPSFFRPWYVPDIKTAVHPNWQTKIKITAKKASEESKISLLGGTPTWLLTICKTILAQTNKKKLSDLWPNLKAYIHGGVNFKPYRTQFEELIDIEDFRFIEVYNATEGFFAVQDRKEEAGMLLMCASGIFYEFIEYVHFKNGIHSAVPIEDTKLDTNYVMIISTYSGLLRYIQGDLVQFVTIAPYRIIVTGRVKEYINAFGEDMMLHHVQEALRKTNDKFKASVKNFTVAPFYITLENKGCHDWYIEFEKKPSNISKYEVYLDQKLIELNPNYQQKRTNDLALSPLRVFPLPHETIDKYFKRYSSLGGQTKLQKLRNDRLIVERIEELLN